MILLNFKNHPEALGQGALKLAKICLKLMEEYKVEIIPCVGALDWVRVKEVMGDKKVYLQHIDGEVNGSSTGKISLLAAKELGVDGTLLNHSEFQIRPGMLGKIVKDASKEMEIVVCIKSLGQAEKWARKLKCRTVAYEPSYLIGSKDKSVASEKGEVIKKLSLALKDKILLAGAGVHQASDVTKALELGCKGVLVSSDVVKAKNPEAELKELVRAFVVYNS